MNPLKIKLYLGLLLDSIVSQKTSLEKALSTIVKKYGLKSSEAEYLYRLSYKVLIYYHSIKFLASMKGYKPRPSQIVEFLHQRGYDVKDILDELDDLTKNLSHSTRIALLHGYPPWLVSDLYGKIQTEELEAMLKSLNVKKRWLVVNTFKTTTEKAVECLEKHGIEVQVHDKFDDLLLVKDPFKKIGNIPCVVRGEVISQDISSYVIVRLLESYSGDLIDACSAPGLKLSQILLRGLYSRVIAVDLSDERVSYIPSVVGKIAGIKPHLIVINGDSRTLVFNTRDVTVFIDAPCSNSGSIYSNPTVKVYISRYLVKRASRIQFSLLRNAIRHATRIIYAVCSIHPREGEEVVYRLLREVKGLKLVETRLPYGSEGYTGYDISKKVTRLHPHVINGQGFFLAVIEPER